MERKSKNLRQVMDIYLMIERLRRVEAERTLMDVTEIGTAIKHIEEELADSILSERNALMANHSLDRLLAAKRHEIGALKRLSLERELDLRTQRHRIATHTYIDSKQWSERVKAIVKEIDRLEKVSVDKKEQAQADDHYVSAKRRADLAQHPTQS
jgi:hypothetical protein